MLWDGQFQTINQHLWRTSFGDDPLFPELLLSTHLTRTLRGGFGKFREKWG